MDTINNVSVIEMSEVDKANALVAADRERRTKMAESEIREVLNRYNCDMSFTVSFQSDSKTPIYTVTIYPL